MGYYATRVLYGDRKKEMVNVGREGLPREWKRSCIPSGHREAALVPQPDAKLGEIPVAWLPQTRGNLTEGSW